MRRTLRFGVLVAFVAACGADTTAQQEPIRFSLIEGAAHLLRPVAAAPVTTVYANFVDADVVVAPDGSVESVMILQGNPAHVGSASAALKQWTFSPFLHNGRPARAIVTVKIYVPDQLTSAAEIASATINATAFGLLRECERLVNAKEGPRAERVCAEAVVATDSLPADAVLERSGARALLGHAFLLQQRPREALAQYEQELVLRRRVLSSSDAELASAYRHLGVARFALADLKAADENLAQAVTILEAAMRNLPLQRSGYQERLGAILREQALVKRALGDTASASALERKAAALLAVPSGQ